MKPLASAFLILALAILTLVVACVIFMAYRNPQVVRELIEDPRGTRAQKVMLLTLPSGRVLPVNYLREGSRVYAGADFGWWRELEGEGFPVEVQVFGEKLSGRGRVVLDDPDYVKDVFARLRPNALPGFGKLVEIRLDPSDPGGAFPPAASD